MPIPPQHYSDVDQGDLVQNSHGRGLKPLAGCRCGRVEFDGRGDRLRPLPAAPLILSRPSLSLLEELRRSDLDELI